MLDAHEICDVLQLPRATVHDRPALGSAGAAAEPRSSGAEPAAGTELELVLSAISRRVPAGARNCGTQTNVSRLASSLVVHQILPPPGTPSPVPRLGRAALSSPQVATLSTPLHSPPPSFAGAQPAYEESIESRLHAVDRNLERALNVADGTATGPSVEERMLRYQ